jgi:hypothetical protein
MVETKAIELHPQMPFKHEQPVINYAAHPRANDKTHVSYYKKSCKPEGKEPRKSRWETKEEN